MYSSERFRQALGQSGLVLCLLLSAAPVWSAQLTVSSTPSGANVSLDGEDMGVTPVSVELSGTDVRQCELILSKDGHAPIRMAFTLALDAEKLQAVHFFLTSTSGETVVPPGPGADTEPPDEPEPAEGPALSSYSPTVAPTPAPPAGDEALNRWIGALLGALNPPMR